MFKENYNQHLDFINLDKLYEKAKKVIDDDRVNMEQFSEHYGAEQVERDMKFVEKMEREFKKNNNNINTVKIATILEAVLGEHIELSEWFGPSVTTMSTTRFDDIVNGVDLITEFADVNSEFAHLGLGIDATYSNNLSSKFLNIRKKIESGKLSSIKYFHSYEMDFMGRLSRLPQVVIAIDAKTAEDIISLWGLNKKQELSEHYVQFQILEQIILQLEAFKNYTLSFNFSDNVDSDRLVRKFKTFINLFEDIYSERRQVVKDSGERDNSTEKIRLYLSDVFK